MAGALPAETRRSRSDTTVAAIFTRADAEQASLAEFEAEYGPVGRADGKADKPPSPGFR